ncbi:MAG: type II 3-dehydroquinate dehydratase [Clostridia bacterium]|nr:type II 3-dehydroquinate dehydratase [Clostridia bacterium]
MRLLVLNGPNLNLLGLREPEIYGKQTYDDLCAMIAAHADEKGLTVDCRQSNHEGVLVDLIQGAYGVYDGIILNPGAYTHTSIALLDALQAVGLPTVEVHISDVAKREPFRQISYVGLYAEKRIIGRGLQGYLLAIDHFLQK